MKVDSVNNFGFGSGKSQNEFIDVESVLSSSGLIKHVTEYKLMALSPVGTAISGASYKVEGEIDNTRRLASTREYLI